MHKNFDLYFALLLIIVVLVVVAKRIRVAYPILLVLGGLAISQIPAVPNISINPDYIFFLVLPPLLYEAAWNASWKELWRWRRIIFSFAFILVFASSLAVAITVNYMIPGFSLALGMLLGGIVSPPDAVSVGAILDFVKLPKRYASILEGESLLNDASSLIVMRFAMIAVGTGQFIWTEALGSFAWMCIGGVGIGLILGFLFMKTHKLLPTDSDTDLILTMVAPFLMYFVAEEVHASGVLAVVSGGLLVSHKIHTFMGSASRLKGYNVWEGLVFLLNGAVFMMIGMNLPDIIEGMPDTTLWLAVEYGMAVTAVLILVRIVAAYAGALMTNFWLKRRPKEHEDAPGWKAPFIIGWAGMRGVVSLAAAFAIPETIQTGQGFPYRNLILVITFVVILFTLLIQGLTLPLFIKKLKLKDPDHTLPEREVDSMILHELAHIGLSLLENKYPVETRNSPQLQDLAESWRRNENSSDIIINRELYREVYRDILKHQRHWLELLNRDDPRMDEDMIKKHMLLLDLQEQKMNISF